MSKKKKKKYKSHPVSEEYKVNIPEKDSEEKLTKKQQRQLEFQQQAAEKRSRQARLLLLGAIVIVLGLTVFNVLSLQLGMMWGMLFLGVLNLINAYYNLKAGKKGDAIFMGASGGLFILVGAYFLLEIILG